MKKPEINVFKNPQWDTVLATGKLPPDLQTGIALTWPQPPPIHFPVSTDVGTEYLLLAHLQCIQSMGQYSLLYMHQPGKQELRKVVVNTLLKKLDSQLFPYGFLRIHKEYMINLALLHTLTSGEHECIMPCVVMCNNKPLPFIIGDRFYNDAIALINLYMQRC